ncbi:MAG: sulfate ABC transporter substrate-binding protein [Mycobacteriaceae bacterium]
MRFNAYPALSAMALLTASAIALTSCSGGSSDSYGGEVSGDGPNLTLVAFAVPQPGFEKIIEAFSETKDGEGVNFSQSYGASGDQSRKVDSGADADIVSFSVEPDITRLVKSGKVDENWDKDAFGGVPFGSVVTLVVREGNPKNIKEWDDLLRSDVEVVSPNPLSSGSAKWNLLAPYAAKSFGGQNPQAGLDFVNKLITEHIRVRPSSGREATDLFLQGTGDVLVSYENEAINSERNGAAIEHIIPASTFKIENPLAILNGTVQIEKAIQFKNFLYSSEAQRIWAKNGFRPVDPSVAAEFIGDFPTPSRLWTIKDLGGWSAVDSTLFAKDEGLITKIYSAATR